MSNRNIIKAVPNKRILLTTILKKRTLLSFDLIPSTIARIYPISIITSRIIGYTFREKLDSRNTKKDTLSNVKVNNNDLFPSLEFTNILLTL